MGTLSITSAVLNAAILPLAIMAWLQLALSIDETRDPRHLASRGVESLKYFTVLSNLLSAIVCGIYFVHCGLMGHAAPAWLLVLKLVSAAAVMLTFTTVVTILAPKVGWKPLFSGGNFWMHLVLPLLAAVDCCVFVHLGGLDLWVTLFALIPTALYGAGYLGMLMIHGAEENGKVYDFYGFLRWGNDARTIAILVIVMLAVTWGLAAALWFVSRAVAG